MTSTPDVVVVAERLTGAQLDEVRAVVSLLASRHHRVDVVVPGSRAASRTGGRALAGRAGGRHVRVRDLLLEAAGHTPDGVRRARWRRAGVHRLADAPSATADVVELPDALARRARGGPVEPQPPVWLLGRWSRWVVRERVDRQGRPFQRDYLDPEGRVRLVAWVDRKDDEVTTLLELDHESGEARRARIERWTARRLAAGGAPVPVVAATAWGDGVVDALPKEWREQAVRHGAGTDHLVRAAAGTEGVA